MAQKTPLIALYENLVSSPSINHISEETLLEIASAEAAGEDITTHYAQATQHMEYCVRCASAYAEVMDLLIDMEAMMVEAAEAVSPATVFEAMLRSSLSGEIDGDFLGAFVAQLPASFADFPAGITPDQIYQIANQTNHADQLTPAHIETLSHALQQNLTALHHYLRSQAAKAWQQAVRISTEALGQWRRITLAPVPPKAVATLSGHETGDHRLLFSRTRDRLLRLNVDADMTKQSDLTCELKVRVDRPGLRKVAGRVVILTYNNQPYTKTTNENGVVTFSDVPIVVLSQLKLDIG